MAIAIPINDPTKNPWTLVRTINGYTGTKYYRVRTETLAQVYVATNLPRLGDIWDATLLEVRVVSIDPKIERAGGDWWLVEIGYEHDAGQIPEAGLVTTTVITPSSTSVTVKYDLDCKQIAADKGRGESKLLTVIMFEVVSYHQILPDLMTYRILSDEPKINKDPVTLVNLMGSGQDLSVDKEQLLYVGFSVARVGDLFAITSRLHWARDWRASRPKENAAGTCENPGPDSMLYFRMYDTASFAGVI